MRVVGKGYARLQVGPKIIACGQNINAPIHRSDILVSVCYDTGPNIVACGQNINAPIYRSDILVPITLLQYIEACGPSSMRNFTFRF
jgi:hypothetical protein